MLAAFSQPYAKEGIFTCKIRKRILCACLALALMLTGPFCRGIPAQADSIESRLANGYYWPNIPRTVYIDLSYLPNEYYSSAVAAMNVWNQVRSYDNEQMVTFQPSSNSTGPTGSKITVESLEPGMSGHTEVSSSGYALTAVHIKLNAGETYSTNTAPNTYDVQTVIMHELGHSLGVRHCHEEWEDSCFSPTCILNVMQWQILHNEYRRTLQDYDRSSYQAVYSDIS